MQSGGARSALSNSQMLNVRLARKKPVPAIDAIAVPVVRLTLVVVVQGKPIEKSYTQPKY